jgi:REP element-mobilizing transposase RayT
MAFMPRPLRIEYAGAIYHVMSRGDRREMIFLDDDDRRSFLQTLGQACGKTGWQIHAYVLMGNHFHFVLETPQPNLCAGMKWLLGIFTQRWNRRRKAWGHLFGGRYKAQCIDERSPQYLRAACDYVHLNPARAGLVRAGEALESYPWSSYPAYLRPRLRAEWLRTDRLLGEHGLNQAQRGARQQFARRMRVQRSESAQEAPPALLRGWKLGAEDFAAWLSNKLGRRGRPSERTLERRETDEQRAESLVRAGLKAGGWTRATLGQTAKSHPVKVSLARELRASTPMTRAWIAERLKMGSASYLSALLSVNHKN